MRSGSCLQQAALAASPGGCVLRLRGAIRVRQAAGIGLASIFEPDQVRAVLVTNGDPGVAELAPAANGIRLGIAVFLACASNRHCWQAMPPEISSVRRAIGIRGLTMAECFHFQPS
jgi:hypothetical protein